MRRRRRRTAPWFHGSWILTEGWHFPVFVLSTLLQPYKKLNLCSYIFMSSCKQLLAWKKWRNNSELDCWASCAGQPDLCYQRYLDLIRRSCILVLWQRSCREGTELLLGQDIRLAVNILTLRSALPQVSSKNEKLN